MSRRDGFPVMDVSTDFVNDPKFRRVQRVNPDHVAPAIAVYMAVLGESWKAGERASAVDAWPVLLPYDEGVIQSMQAAGLLDRRSQITVKAWEGWFREAFERREKTRERWRRANEKREGRAESRTDDSADTAPTPRGTASQPRGDSADASRIHRRSRPIPNPIPIPSDSESESQVPPRATGNRSKKNGADQSAGENVLEAWRPFSGRMWLPFIGAWRARGLRLPPGEAQRETLFEAVDARPDDVASWVAEVAAGASTFDVVAHVLERWHAIRDEAMARADRDEIAKGHHRGRRATTRGLEKAL
jgi:hypothetical protein